MLKNYYGIIIILIILLAIGGFYWFQYRPAEVKKECNTKSVEYYKETFNGADDDGDGKVSRNTVDGIEQNMDLLYKSCLHSKGL